MNYTMITGASSGIGLEYAQQLAALGHNIVVVSNQREANDMVATMLVRDYHVHAIPLFADLANENSAQEIYDYCHQNGIVVDILISNAGILHFGKLVHSNEADIRRILNLHCLVPTLLCRLFAKDMCQRHHGHILLMSSMAAWTPLPTMSLYGATKTYVRNFGQSLWYELRPEGVSVTTICPSAVDTHFFKLDDKVRKRLRRIGIIITPQRLVRGALKAMFAHRRRYIPDIWTHIEIALCNITPPCIFRLFFKIPYFRNLLNTL